MLEEKDLEKVIVVGDRVLIKPKSAVDKTRSGLYLPMNVVEKEILQSGYVIKVGPGYPIPANVDTDDQWKENKENVKYVPLQPKEGDLAVFLHKSSFEIEFDKERYIIVPHSAILLLIRDEGLFG